KVEAALCPAPELDLPEELLMLDGRHDEPDFVRDHHTARLQKTRAGVLEVFEDARLEPEASDLVREDDVDSLGQLDSGRQPLDVADPVTESVGLGDTPGEPDDRALVDCVHALGSGAAGHEPEDPGAGAEVEHDVAGGDDLLDRLAKSGQAAGVGEILPVLVQDERHQTIAAPGRRRLTGIPASSWGPRRRRSKCPCSSASRLVRTR